MILSLSVVIIDVVHLCLFFFFFFQAEDGIRDFCLSRGLGDVYKRQSFDSDIITMDYRVRGFTRTENGGKVFMDHDIMSIQDFIPRHILEKYDTYDVNLYEERVFHTSMVLKKYDLDNYLFNLDAADLKEKTRARIERNLEREMKEIFYGRNFEK